MLKRYLLVGPIELRNKAEELYHSRVQNTVLMGMGLRTAVVKSRICGYDAQE